MQPNPTNDSKARNTRVLHFAVACLVAAIMTAWAITMIFSNASWGWLIGIATIVLAFILAMTFQRRIDPQPVDHDRFVEPKDGPH